MKLRGRYLSNENMNTESSINTKGMQADDGLTVVLICLVAQRDVSRQIKVVRSRYDLGSDTAIMQD